MTTTPNTTSPTSTFGDEAWRWMKALGAAADAAGDDPGRCIALASTVRSVCAGLEAQLLRDTWAAELVVNDR